MPLIATPVPELSGDALDWAVAKLENPQWWDEYPEEMNGLNALCMDDGDEYHPSSQWVQGGPIIERERIELIGDGDDGWLACDHLHPPLSGRTLLVAAMRCYVAGKLGDTIEVPECFL